MICKNCGAMLKDGDRFCQNCGRLIEMSTDNNTMNYNPNNNNTMNYNPNNNTMNYNPNNNTMNYNLNNNNMTNRYQGKNQLNSNSFSEEEKARLTRYANLSLGIGIFITVTSIFFCIPLIWIAFGIFGCQCARLARGLEPGKAKAGNVLCIIGIVLSAIVLLFGIVNIIVAG